jgi:hypothetical protein
LAQLIEHQLHRRGLDSGQDQRDTEVALRADRTEEIGSLMPEIAAAAWPLPLLEPAAAAPAGLADPGLVEKPDLEPIGLGLGCCDLGGQRRELFLNAC